MSLPVRAFVVNTLDAMNLDTSEMTDDTPLGDGGMDMESLTTAELVMHVEEEFGVKFSDDDVEGMQTMTVGAFVAEVERRAARDGAASDGAVQDGAVQDKAEAGSV